MLLLVFDVPEITQWWGLLSNFVSGHATFITVGLSTILFLQTWFSRNSSESISRYYRALQPKASLIKDYETEAEEASQTAFITYNGGACDLTLSPTLLRIRSHATKDIVCQALVADMVGVALRSDGGVRTRLCMTFYPEVHTRHARLSRHTRRRKCRELYIVMKSTGEAYLWLRILRTVVRGGDISKKAIQGTGGPGILPAGRHLAVIVNPVAGEGRGRDIYRYIEPIFHRADALTVEVCESDGPGDIASICQDLDASQCSGIVIVGGDGSVNECVRGLSSRTPDRYDDDSDSESADGATRSQQPGYNNDDGSDGCDTRTVDISMLQVPVGIIPVGHENRIAKSLGITDPVVGAIAVVQGHVRARAGMVVTLRTDDQESTRVAVHRINTQGGNAITMRSIFSAFSLPKLSVRTQVATPGREPPALVPPSTVTVEARVEASQVDDESSGVQHARGGKKVRKGRITVGSQSGDDVLSIIPHGPWQVVTNYLLPWSLGADGETRATTQGVRVRGPEESPQLSVKIDGEQVSAGVVEVSATLVQDMMLWMARASLPEV